MADRAVLLAGLSDPIARIFEERAAIHSLRLIRSSSPSDLSLRSQNLVLCVLGVELAQEDLTELASGISKRSPATPVVVLSRGLPASLAFQLANAGVADVIDLPMPSEDLAARVLAHIGRSPDRGEELIVGESLEVRRVRDEIAQLAAASSGVLVLGETGTGKELAAREIHRQSRRARGPFVALNCGELQAESVRSDLFGHVRGAFTGAIADRMGAFEVANDGTLFLDEIGELGLGVQPQLLRVLESAAFQPLGAVRPRSTNARLIAATHRDLGDAAAMGGFRLDLFERIAVLVVAMPPLREHKSDIPLLARTALDRTSARLGWPCPDISDSFYERLMSVDHTWPGNVRELFHVIERCLVMHGRSHDRLDHSHVDRALDSRRRKIRFQGGSDVTLSDFPASVRVSPELVDERCRIAAALQRAGGNVRAAARILDRHVNTLWSQIDRFELQEYLNRLKV